jgi:hypothetical protein
MPSGAIGTMRRVDGGHAPRRDHTRRNRRQTRPDLLPQQLEQDFERAFGRAPQRKQLEWLERVGRWLGRCYHAEGEAFVRSVPQIVRALGLPYDGTVKGARRRYRNQLANTLGYLEAMGWVEAREALLRSSGHGRGWALRIAPRGSAALRSINGARRRTRRDGGPHGAGTRPAGHPEPLAPASRSRGLHPPTENSTDQGLTAFPLSCSGRGRAHANRRYGGPFAVAALEAKVRQGGGEAAAVLEAEWQAGAPLWACLRAAARALDVPAALSRRAELQAERSVAQMDRLAGRRGEGVRQLLWLLEEGAESRTGEVAMPVGPNPLIDRRSPGRRPVSLGYYITAFRRQARKWRRDEKAKG